MICTGPAAPDTVRDRIRGSLIAGAAGDALGYAVEFDMEKEIFRRWGPGGIQSLSADPMTGKAFISDDTQMTLFTGTGLLLGTTRGKTRGIMGSYADYIRSSYKDWYRTQTERFPECGVIGRHLAQHLPQRERVAVGGKKAGMGNVEMSVLSR